MTEESGTATQTAEETTTETTETTAQNPDAVLRKNQELLGKLAKAKEHSDAQAARLAGFEQAEAEREEARLKKNGEIEKLYQTRLEAKDKDILARDDKYSRLFQRTAEKELALELTGSGVFKDEAARLAKLLRLDHIKPIETETGDVTWQTLDGLETVTLKDFIPSLRSTYGRFFEGDNVTGGNAPGNNGGGSSGRGKKWPDMSLSERSAAIREFRGDTEAAKKKYS